MTTTEATAQAATTKQTTKPHKILPHGDLEELVPGAVWMVSGHLPFPLKRNMTVVKLGDGTLLLHSVVAMNDDGMARLDALGKPSVVIVPHGGHRMDARFYKARYPEARVVCPIAARVQVEQVVKVDATCEEALPPLGIRLHALAGFKNGELGYELDIPGGRALILCDAAANADHPPGLGGVLMATLAGGIRGRLGVPRIVRFMLIKDKAVARQDLAKLADIPDLKILTVGHGRPLRDGCAEALREAASSF
jgi:hypothetical protein